MKAGDKYKHFKGKIVEIVCIAKDSETLEDIVIYREDDNYWARKYKMFTSLVDKEKHPNVNQKYRFEKVK